MGAGLSLGEGGTNMGTGRQALSEPGVHVLMGKAPSSPPPACSLVSKYHSPEALGERHIVGGRGVGGKWTQSQEQVCQPKQVLVEEGDTGQDTTAAGLTGSLPTAKRGTMWASR